jgi:hypothetical protein
MNLEKEISDMKARVHVLEQKLVGRKWLNIALAFAIARQADRELSDVLEDIKSALAVATASESEAAALPIKDVTDHLHALADGATDPRLALLARAAQYAAAGPDRRHALSTWLAQATPDEIADDLLQLLREHAPGSPGHESHPGDDS